MRLRTTALPSAVLTLLLLTACGGGGGDGDGVASLGGDAKDDDTTATTLSEEDQEEAMLDWAACMREQGIDMPDPQFNGDGGVSVQIGGGPGGGADDDEGTDDGGANATPMDRDAFETAREECGDPPMLGRELTEEDRAEMEKMGLEFAECMRDNGVEDFPDPDFSETGPGAGPMTRVDRFDDDDDADAQGSSEVVAGPFGVVELDDPEVKAAFEACQADIGFGPGGGRGGPGGPPVAVAEASS